MTEFVCPQVIAHRGASYYAPENTKAAIVLAAQQGAKWIEVDLWMTQDKDIVIIHNSTVNKRTNGAGKVVDFTMAELARLDAGSWFGPEYAGEQLLSLEQLIKLTSSLNINVNLEIKANTAANEATALLVGQQIKKLWPKGKPLPLVSSFSLQVIEAMHAHFPLIPRALLLEKWTKASQNTITDLHCSSINISRRAITKKSLASMHETGLPVLIYTVNGIKSALDFIEMGVEGIFTDRPDRILEALHQKGLSR